MSAKILDGKAVAAALRAGLQSDIAAVREARGTPPKLAIVTHTSEESAGAYLRAKLKAAAEAGLLAQAYPCPDGAGPGELGGILARLGADDAVDGIIVEQPLPKGFDPALVFSAIPQGKDVEGVNPVNYGRFFLAKTAAEIAGCGAFPPCTVAAVIALLGETGSSAAGREAVVVGRSEILGRPAAHYLSALDATVTLCHSKTADLAGHVRRADIVVAALGRANFIKGGWIKPGAVVLDAGMNRHGGAWVGDVEFAAAAQRASFITPVPGGVGPVTTAVVLANTVEAARRRLEVRSA
ncbi:MAG: bifunctional 5,10-methylenetetrahydrofolate dehydrogenase/5,10-methenyltetrahydrofolate cyclohydrolase [Elusimicrobia bacterium]|nr:bifunctional 5,10-methylenetetrahydrofolate dehydrogenase/5,10-methenyltetrahydrofolate cyclohydrolase [Elusimicrobiota bacterium]